MGTEICVLGSENSLCIELKYSFLSLLSRSLDIIYRVTGLSSLCPFIVSLGLALEDEKNVLREVFEIIIGISFSGLLKIVPVFYIYIFIDYYNAQQQMNFDFHNCYLETASILLPLFFIY